MQVTFLYEKFPFLTLLPAALELTPPTVVLPWGLLSPRDPATLHGINHSSRLAPPLEWHSALPQLDDREVEFINVLPDTHRCSPSVTIKIIISVISLPFPHRGNQFQ